MISTTLTVDDYTNSCKDFIRISDRISDGWKYYNQVEDERSYLKKESFISCSNKNDTLFKIEYVIFYSQSYEVPCLSFNIWDSTGCLLSLEAVREISLIKIQEKDFYSVITQQEHPLFFKPYFIMHPCHTSEVISLFKQSTKNIIVTFLGLITPLLPLKLPLEYGY